MAPPKAASSAPSDPTFPCYPDGDVLIFLSPNRYYQLHSTTLRLSSTFFHDVLTEASAANMDSLTGKHEGVVQYRLELELPEEDEAAGTDEPREGAKGKGVGRLIPKSVGEFPTTTNAKHVSTVNEPRLYIHYDNALRSLFHRPLILCETSGLRSLLHDALGLVDVAEYLGCVGCVSKSLDVSLVNYGQTLFRSVAGNPRVWADLGVRIHSEVVVREAVCHLVGQAGTNFMAGKTESEPEQKQSEDTTMMTPTMPMEFTALVAKQDLQQHQKNLQQLIYRKSKDLDARKQATEMRLMGFYPDTMMWSEAGTPNVATGSRTTRGSGVPTKVGHHTKHIYDWMAINLFRHWMGQHVCTDRTRRAADGGYHFYTCVARAGQDYIDQQARENFTQYFPLSAKARTGFDLSVGNIKEGVKKYVADLVQVRCSLDVKQFPVQWLTCTEVGREEMPWNVCQPTDAATKDFETSKATGTATGVVSSGGLDETEVLSVGLTSKEKGKGRKVDPLPKAPRKGRATAAKPPAKVSGAARKRKQPDLTRSTTQQAASSGPGRSTKRLRSEHVSSPASSPLSDCDDTAETISGGPSRPADVEMQFEIGEIPSHAEFSAAGAKRYIRKAAKDEDDETKDRERGDLWDADDEYGE